MLPWPHLLQELCRVAWLAGLTAGLATCGSRTPVPKHVEAAKTLEGKTVFVRLNTAPASNCLLEEVTVRQLGGRSFLVGRLADYRRPATPGVGLKLWAAVDEVADMMEFKNADKARKFCRSARSQAPAPPAGRHSETSSECRKLDSDVVEFDTREFDFPLHVTADGGVPDCQGAPLLFRRPG
jgi:hypothetical protein